MPTQNSREVYPINRSRVTQVESRRALESALLCSCSQPYSASLKVMKLARP